MKKILIFTIMIIATTAWSQQLMTSSHHLFSEDANTLQPLFVAMIPGTPVAGFCPGLIGSFESIKIENAEGNMEETEGLLVTAIIVDKGAKKIVGDLNCFWDSSNPEIVTVVPVAKGNKRLYALLPKKVGDAHLTIKMGTEEICLGIVVSKGEASLRFEVKKAVVDKKSNDSK